MNNPPTFEAVRAALACIPPDLGHEDRVRLAFAVFDGLGDAGAELWQEWAAQRAKPDAAEDRATWKSARKPGPVKVGTLFGIAKDHGFTFEAVQTSAPRPTPAELKAQAEARRAKQEREARDKADAQAAAADDAARVWDAAALEGSSAYLDRKGVKGHGVRFAASDCRNIRAGDVLVPGCDAEGKVWTVQGIANDKRFLTGGRASGGVHHVIGDPSGAAWLLVGEGYATLASCFEATGRPAVVAFTSGNLAPTVRALRGRYPAARLLVIGDDDAETEARTGKNPGREKATEAARLAGGHVVFPKGLPAGGSDFNDLHQAAGLEAVRELIEGAIVDAESAAGEKAAQRDDKARGTDGKGKAKGKAPAARQRPARGSGDDEPGIDDDGDGARVRDRFRADEDGVWYIKIDERDNRPSDVCGPLFVTALARDANNNGASLLLEFDTPFQKGRRWLMPLAMLAGDGTEYRRELFSMGFFTPTDRARRTLLTEYLESRRPAELVRIVDRIGWHGRAYVLPRETLGDDGGERILFQSEAATEGTFERLGTLAQWQERTGRFCLGNSRLMFAASCAFAGPLLAWAPGTDGGGFHLVGDSSCGKTTALRVAASVWGGRDYLQRWRATDNGIEAMAAQHSDGCLCLDELAQLDAKVAGEAAYMLANGQGKSRAGRTGAARPRLTWRLLFLSAGEIGLAEHMSEANKRTRAGQELRMIDLPADAGAGLGIFEDCHGHEGGGALSQYLTRATGATYGTPGRAWLEHLTGRTEGLSRTLRERMDVIERAFVPETAAGQVQRVGRRFALVAVAGEMATEAGLTGWPAGAATDAARACFNAWIGARPGGIGLTEDAQILRQVRQFFGMHGDSRFKPWQRTDEDNKPNTPLMAGWRKEIKGDIRNDEGELIKAVISREYFVFPDVFRAEACKGFTERAVLKLLHERGHLVREGKGKHFACRASPPGAEKVSVYRIKSSLLSDSEE
jgi:putative DNA primase/helicase